MFDWDSGMPLRFVNVPTLIIGGGVDLVTKLEASETMAAAAATIELFDCGRRQPYGISGTF
jgi:pimeloyl-ACP methyl ester carboxylesterase